MKLTESTSKPGLKGRFYNIILSKANFFSDTFYTTGSTLDHVLSEPTTEDPPTIVHYADPTADSFRPFFNYFIKRSKRLHYILRWAPTRNDSFRPQKLSGWGVKMDLKKREYLSHDDRVNAEKIINIQTNVASDMSDEEYGVLQPFLKDAFAKPLQTIETKEAIRSLSGNLIALLQKSDNPLGLLTAITQNLPLLAPQLAETVLDGSDDILKELSYNQEKYIEAGQNAIWLNGRRLYDVDIEPFR